MIIREWRGRANPSQAEAYPKHFREKVIPELRQIPGFTGRNLAATNWMTRSNFWC
jgi:hypothetical protein